MANLSRLLLAFGLAVRATLAAAPETPSTNSSDSIIPGAYVIELEDGHTSDSFYNDLGDKNLNASRRLDFDYSLFRGVSFQLGESDDHKASEKEIKKLPGVKKLWPVNLVTLPKNEVKWTVPQNATALELKAKREEAGSDTYSPHVMTQVDKLRKEGYTGKGIRIGIIDSGVDYNHPALGGCFGKGCLISHGTDLIGDDYDGYNSPQPDDDPHDSCQGHGTHVAGIIAAQQNEFGFSGASPGVDLGMYRVVSCTASTTDDVMAAAFNQAYEDGNDIITCSMGRASGWPENHLSVTVQRIVEAGVPCTLSAGNGGSGGLFLSSFPANGKGVTAVGSVDDHEIPWVFLKGSYTVDNSSPHSFKLVAGEPKFPNITLPLYAFANASNGDDVCNALPDDTPDLSEYMVLVKYGMCSDTVIAENIAAKGGKYVMTYNESPDGVINPNMSEVGAIEGCGSISLSQATEWKKLLESGDEVLVTVTDPDFSHRFLDVTPNSITGGFMSNFSSWGPTWELDVNPVISAPGGNILSTYPLKKGSYTVMSGTSMSCPLMAAIYALVMEARGKTDPKTLMNIFTTTSQPNLWNDGSSPVGDRLAPVPQQGAGLVQAHKAAHISTLLSVPFISFNDTEHFQGIDNFTLKSPEPDGVIYTVGHDAAITIKNTGSEEVTYNLGHVAAITMYTFNKGDNYPASFPNPIAEAWAGMDFSTSKVTVPAGGAAEITVTCTPPEGLDESRIPVYSGYITVNGTNNESLSIPYLGAIGSMYSLPILDPENTSLVSYNNSLTRPGANETWTLEQPETPTPPTTTASDYPTVAISLNIGTALLRVDVVPLDSTNATTKKVLGTEIIGSMAGTPREYTPQTYLFLPFTGMTQEGDIVPPGSYVFEIKALKIFGDREKLEDYQVLRTVPFNIKYS